VAVIHWSQKMKSRKTQTPGNLIKRERGKTRGQRFGVVRGKRFTMGGSGEGVVSVFESPDLRTLLRVHVKQGGKRRENNEAKEGKGAGAVRGLGTGTGLILTGGHFRVGTGGEPTERHQDNKGGSNLGKN